MLGFPCRSSRLAAREQEIRSIVVEAVLRNPLAALSDPRAKERLKTGHDVTFDELGLDSLARLTLAVDLDGHGFPVSERDVNDARGINGLTRRLTELGH